MIVMVKLDHIWMSKILKVFNISNRVSYLMLHYSLAHTYFIGD